MEDDGASYRGTVNVTGTGRTCQRWDRQTPHKHTRTSANYPSSGLEQNYCRNPDHEPTLWCYTTDPGKRWEFCDVPHCDGQLEGVSGIECENGRAGRSQPTSGWANGSGVNALLRNFGSVEPQTAVRIGSAQLSLRSRLNLALLFQVYKAVVITALLYGCETWTLYRKQLKALDIFHLRCLRRIMGITWTDRIPNTEVLRRANMPGIEAFIMKAQLRWAGHLVRIDKTRLPKIVFYCELASGSRKVGRPYKRYKDSLKSYLTACSIPHREWESTAADRSSWRHAVRHGVKTFEENRLDELDRKRRDKKGRRPDPSATVVCPVCGRTCASAFGLRSHLRRH
ncbi:hypothetical protein Bbelb_372690 [Branchiostoma belcheri]|nr:hypothetical protein Bbelb_372690 [Branchiostoma belcheri]